jgi:hypothetical protein
METKLKQDFTRHFGLLISTTPNIRLQTSAPYFEIEDDTNRQTQLHFIVGRGMAAYKNPRNYVVEIINYDLFITSLPQNFQQGKKRCDLIVYTTNNKHFLLNELKDRIPKIKVRNKSIEQLKQSLELIMQVHSISAFADAFENKKCCFFNKQSMAPKPINATGAFNRINAIAINGIKTANKVINSYGFELFEYSGGQAYNL